MKIKSCRAAEGTGFLVKRPATEWDRRLIAGIYKELKKPKHQTLQQLHQKWNLELIRVPRGILMLISAF